MPDTPLARSGPVEPVLGTWTFAGDKIWGATDEQSAIAVIHAALDNGITLIDTAPNYGGGRSEEVLGRAVFKRSAARIATKIKIDDLSAAEMRASVEASLKRLKRDAIDLVQVHWPAPQPKQTSLALDTLEQLQRDGLIAEIGVCNFGSTDLAEQRSRAIVSNQLPYSVLWRVVEDEIGPLSAQHGRAPIAYTALQQGLLTGRYSSVATFPLGRQRTRLFSSDREAARHNEPGHEQLVDDVLAGLAVLADRSGYTMVQLALGYVAAQPWIQGVLIGARTTDQLQATMQALTVALDSQTLNAIDRITTPLKDALGPNPDMYQSPSRIRHRTV